VTTDEVTGELLDVYLVNFPLDVYQRAQEHADGLIREFTLIAQDRAGGNAVDLPVQLLAIIGELASQYADVSSRPEAQRDAAIQRGESFVDLHYQVPREAAAASIHLGSIFDAADDYCRAGQHLLSLATPPEALEFRRWFINEFVSQIRGAEPVPWPPAGHSPGKS
jgi:hypothetical protein